MAEKVTTDRLAAILDDYLNNKKEMILTVAAAIRREDSWAMEMQEIVLVNIYGSDFIIGWDEMTFADQCKYNSEMDELAVLEAIRRTERD